MSEYIDDMVKNLIYEEGILLECLQCQNKKRFHFRMTRGCTIIVDNESSKTSDNWYPFYEAEITCVDCSHIIWRE